MPEWRSVTGFPRYEVSDDGDVMNRETGKVLKPIHQSTGYSTVTLTEGKRRQSIGIHRIVANEFIPNPESKPMVNHLDGDKSNNRLENLEWCTCSENMKHAYRIGLQKPNPGQIEQSLARSVAVRSRPVRNVETGAEYRSIAECAKAENLRHTSVSFHVTGKARKPRFEYIEKQEV